MNRYLLIVLLLGLAIISLITLKSIDSSLVSKQFLFFIFGFLIILSCFFVSIQSLIKLSIPFYMLLVSLLIILLIKGEVTRGVTAWFELFGGLKLQPSQFSIPLTLLTLGAYFEKINKKDIKQFIISVLIIAVPGILIVIQPDMGTAVVHFVTCFSILLFVSFPPKHILYLMSLGVITIVIGWFLVLKDFQKQRFTNFISLIQDEAYADYNTRQAIIAVGSGQVMGRGLGYGIQSHLRFLPERQNDFIFASLAEEWGLLGSSIVVLIYAGIIFLIIRESLITQNLTYHAILMAVAIMFFIQIAINIGMNIGLLPITGITLPFVSYGGSSIISISITSGLVVSIVKESRKKRVIIIR